MNIKIDSILKKFDMIWIDTERNPKKNKEVQHNLRQQPLRPT